MNPVRLLESVYNPPQRPTERQVRIAVALMVFPLFVVAGVLVRVGLGDAGNLSTEEIVWFALFAISALAVWPALAILQAELRHNEDLPSGEWKWWLLVFLSLPPAAAIYWCLYRR